MVLFSLYVRGVEIHSFHYAHGPEEASLVQDNFERLREF